MPTTSHSLVTAASEVAAGPRRARARAERTDTARPVEMVTSGATHSALDRGSRTPYPDVMTGRGCGHPGAEHIVRHATIGRIGERRATDNGAGGGITHCFIANAYRERLGTC